MLRFSGSLLIVCLAVSFVAETASGQLFRGFRNNCCRPQVCCPPVNHCNTNCNQGYQVQVYQAPSYNYSNSGCGCHAVQGGMVHGGIVHGGMVQGGMVQGGMVHGGNMNGGIVNGGQVIQPNVIQENGGTWPSVQQDCDREYSLCESSCNSCTNQADKQTCLLYCDCQRKVCNGTMPAGSCTPPPCGGVIVIGGGVN